MVSSQKQSAKKTSMERTIILPYFSSMYWDPSIAFSTSDWDELAKICQHDWTEYLKISKSAKFEVIRSDLYGGGGGGGASLYTPPPTIQMSLQFHDFEEQYLYSL